MLGSVCRAEEALLAAMEQRDIQVLEAAIAAASDLGINVQPALKVHYGNQESTPPLRFSPFLPCHFFLSLLCSFTGVKHSLCYFVLGEQAANEGCRARS